MFQTKVKQQVEVFLSAWMYFTRVPLPKRLQKFTDGSQQSLERAIQLLPLFGVLVGAVSGFVFLGANWAFDNIGLAVLLSMVTSIVLTGALHEDGLGDFFDGFGGGWWSKKRILEIMKDSRTGTFGILAISLALLLKFNALMAINPTMILPTLIAAHAFSRFAAASFFYTNQYVQANDQSYFKPMAKGAMSRQDFLILSLLGTAPILLLGDWRYLLLIPVLWIVRQLFGQWFVKKIGGYTGDCLGATQQVIEICFYLCIVIISRFV